MDLVDLVDLMDLVDGAKQLDHIHNSILPVSISSGRLLCPYITISATAL